MVFRQQPIKDDENQDQSTEEGIKSTNRSKSETIKVKEQHLKQRIKEERIIRCKSKSLYRQFAKESVKETINRNQFWAWYSYANFKTETEALITACHIKPLQQII